MITSWLRLFWPQLLRKGVQPEKKLKDGHGTFRAGNQNSTTSVEKHVNRLELQGTIIGLTCGLASLALYAFLCLWLKPTDNKDGVRETGRMSSVSF
jgi:hypothetical protein